MHHGVLICWGVLCAGTLRIAHVKYRKEYSGTNTAQQVEQAMHRGYFSARYSEGSRRSQTRIGGFLPTPRARSLCGSVRVWVTVGGSHPHVEPSTGGWLACRLR